MVNKFGEKQKYQHRHHNKNLLMAHLIFATKYRKSILCNELRSDMKRYIYDTCRRYHWYIKAMETDNDHLHILLQYNPTDSISRIVSLLKQHSTYRVWQDHGPFLCKHYWKEKTFWSDGYFAASIGEVSSQTIEFYIANQGKGR